MIDIRGLRIGNQIFNVFGEVIEVDANVLSELESYPGHHSIPVTIELLLKAGFVFENGMYRDGLFSIKPTHGTFEWVIYWNDKELLCEKHLAFHRLQNIVFDLAWKELKI